MAILKNFIIIFVAIFASGKSAAAQDSIARSSGNHPVVRALVAPTLLLAAGAFSNQFKYQIRDARNRSYPNFHTSLDNYLQYIPIVAVYGLNWAGVKGKNDFANRTALLVKSELLMTVIVQSLKYTTHEERPDGSNDLSFPSGHTAQAFAAATFLQKEFGQKSIWYTIGGYTAATAVGAMRILNNKHWISDVLVGAGIGVLSTNLVYLTHRYHWGKNKKTSQVFLTPTFGKGAGIYFCYTY